MSSFNVFYQDYNNDAAVSSIAPITMTLKQITQLCGALLQQEDNYVGIFDSQESLLELFQHDKQQWIVELSFAGIEGRYHTRMSPDQCLDWLTNLPREFSEKLLPDARFIG